MSHKKGTSLYGLTVSVFYIVEGKTADITRHYSLAAIISC